MDFDGNVESLREAAWSISLTVRGGTMILTFEQNFVTPLPVVIHGQYAVAVLAAATLGAEQRIWVKVREDVLGIADKMHAAMKDRGPAGAFDLGTVTAFIDLLGMVPGPGKPILSKVGEVLGPLATLLGIVIWEVENLNPADKPWHCPPLTAWTHFLDSGRVSRFRLFYGS